MDNMVQQQPAMAGVERVKLVQRSPEWLEFRRTGGIGASEAFVAVTLQPLYRTTPATLAMRKRGELPPEDLSDNLAVFLGTRMEKANREWYERETGLGVQGYGYTLRLGHLIGDLDGLVIPPGQKVASVREEIRTDRLVEFKRCRRWEEDGAGSFVAPVPYTLQAQAYLLLTGCRFADFSCIFKGQFESWHRQEMEADAELGRAVAAKVEEFWERYVVRGEEPRATCEADARLLWARSRARRAVADDAVAEAVRRLVAIDGEVARLDVEAERARTVVMGAMGDAEELVDFAGNRLCTWKCAKASKRTDYKGAFEEASADWDEARRRECAERHTVERPGARRFLLAK